MSIYSICSISHTIIIYHQSLSPSLIDACPLFLDRLATQQLSSSTPALHESAKNSCILHSICRDPETYKDNPAGSSGGEPSTPRARPASSENRPSSSSTETEMSASHRSSHHHSSSSSKGKSSSRSKSKKDDWSEITDPEERRRVQNRIAQRKFRDKAKDAKERQDRDAENRAHAGYSYNTPDPGEMGTDDELSGLPWGSMSLKHVVKKGKAKEDESRRGSRKDEDRSRYDTQEATYYEGQSTYYAAGDRTYYEEDKSYYEERDPVYYDYGSGSGSGHGGSSR